MAVVLYNQGKKDAALRELVEHKESARAELLPQSKTLLFRLGMLYREQGNVDASNQALKEFLVATNGIKTEDLQEFRQQAAKILVSTR